MSKERQTYISKVICSQCRHQARIKIPVKVEINQMQCPKCGLRALHHPSYFGIKQ